MIRALARSPRHVEAFRSIKNLISRIPLWSRDWTESSSFCSSSFPYRYKVRTSDISRLLPKWMIATTSTSVGRHNTAGSDAASRCIFSGGSSQRISSQPEIKISERVKSPGYQRTRLFTLDKHETPFCHRLRFVRPYVRLANGRSGGSSIDSCCPLESVLPWNRPRFVSVTMADDAGGYAHTSDQFPPAEPDGNEGREGESRFNTYDCVPRICKDVTYLSYAHVPA